MDRDGRRDKEVWLTTYGSDGLKDTQFRKELDDFLDTVNELTPLIAVYSNKKKKIVDNFSDLIPKDTENMTVNYGKVTDALTIVCDSGTIETLTTFKLYKSDGKALSVKRIMEVYNASLIKDL